MKKDSNVYETRKRNKKMMEKSCKRGEEKDAEENIRA